MQSTHLIDHTGLMQAGFIETNCEAGKKSLKELEQVFVATFHACYTDDHVSFISMVYSMDVGSSLDWDNNRRKDLKLPHPTMVLIWTSYTCYLHKKTKT